MSVPTKFSLCSSPYHLHSTSPRQTHVSPTFPRPLLLLHTAKQARNAHIRPPTKKSERLARLGTGASAPRPPSQYTARNAKTAPETPPIPLRKRASAPFRCRCERHGTPERNRPRPLVSVPYCYLKSHTYICSLMPDSNGYPYPCLQGFKHIREHHHNYPI